MWGLDNDKLILSQSPSPAKLCEVFQPFLVKLFSKQLPSWFCVTNQALEDWCSAVLIDEGQAGACTEVASFCTLLYRVAT